MIQIEPIPDEPLPPGLVAPGPAWIGSVSFGGCLSIGFFVMLLPAIGILRSFGITPLQSLPILMLIAAVISVITIWRATVYSRKLDESWKQRTEPASANARTAAKRYGYVPSSEGGSQRHRVTISRIDAIWSVDDVALDDLGPGQILRTLEREYIYCAGDAFAELEDVEDGTFYLKETLTLELSGDLDYVESVAGSGQCVPIGSDEVPGKTLPDGLLSRGFAILDDPELIRRLPPIPTFGE
jgi:hypothetical protein